MCIWEEHHLFIHPIVFTKTSCVCLYLYVQVHVCTYVQKLVVDIGCLPRVLATLFCEIESLTEPWAHKLEKTVWPAGLCLLLSLTPYPLFLAFLDQTQIPMLATGSDLQTQLSLQLLFVKTLKSTDGEMHGVSLFNQSVTIHCSWEMYMSAGNNS